MANMNLPLEERNMNPDQVEALDHRRSWGLAMQVSLRPVRHHLPSCSPSGLDRT